MTKTEQFTIGYYFRTLTRLLSEPRQFFSELQEVDDYKNPAVFLIVSSLFFTAASFLVTRPSAPLQTTAIFLVNALGMSIIATILGYIVMVMMFGSRVSFSRLFCIFSLASGVTLLVSWVPHFIWFTEPWKWWLIGAGLVKGCEFRWYQALLIIGITILLMIGIFWTLVTTFF